MKKPYEKPVIKRYQAGIAEKFVPSRGVKIRESIEGYRVSELLAAHGSPLFVYSARQLKRTYQRLFDAFSMRYPRVQTAWSYKTNYLRTICSMYHQLGSWAEVVSPMEYEMARRLGVAPAQIIFNGPYKPYEALKQAITEGALVNVDSLDELQDLEKIADETGQPVQAGIRLNMALEGGYISWDRFGFNLDNDQALHAVKLAAAKGKVRIRGLHAHIGTFILDVDHYRTQVTKLVAFARLLKEKLGLTMEYIDIGGGFASDIDLKGSYLRTSEIIPHFEEYAEAICTPLLDGFGPEELPLLILETGRGLVDEAGSLLATVVATRRLASGRRALVLDAGVNLLFTSFWYNHEILPAVDKGFPVEEQVVYGPLCMQIDVLRESVRLPFLEKGDPVVIRPVGAYNNTQWLQFINLRPAVVLIGEKGEIHRIREPETVEYLQQPENLPDW
jgi:diaminopimelate decarboxylase